MAIVNINYVFTVGAVIIAAQHNSNFSTIYNDYNGNIQNVNIASNAAISYSKLNLAGNVQTTDLVSGFTLPAANGGTGSTAAANAASGVVVLNGSSQLPAVSGALLTNITQGNLSQILDYGTSGTTGTTKAQTALMIAYGTLAVGSQTTATVTNLPFTSASTYVVLVTTESAPQQGIFTAFAVKNSGSQITIYSNDNHADNVCWFCIGT